MDTEKEITESANFWASLKERAPNLEQREDLLIMMSTTPSAPMGWFRKRWLEEQK